MIAPTSSARVVLKDVTRRFGDRAVLDAVSVTFEPGSTVGIVGDNGAGKTSLLRVIAGTLQAQSGSITVGASTKQRCAAFVPAGDRALYWRLTPRQELEFYGGISGVQRRRLPPLIEAVSDLLGLESILDQQIGTMSTGQRRRIMVGRGLVGLAPVLLLDEPFADLDESGKRLVSDACGTWVLHGGTVIWVAPIEDGGPPPSVDYRLAEGRLVDA